MPFSTYSCHIGRWIPVCGSPVVHACVCLALEHRPRRKLMVCVPPLPPLLWLPPLLCGLCVGVLGRIPGHRRQEQQEGCHSRERHHPRQPAQDRRGAACKQTTPAPLSSALSLFQSPKLSLSAPSSSLLFRGLSARSRRPCNLPLACACGGSFSLFFGGWSLCC